MPFIRPIREFRTIRELLGGAERLARQAGAEQPGAEHLLLAAVALSDGTARRAFEGVGADPDRLPEAIEAQHAEALRAVGIAAGGAALPATPAPPTAAIYRSGPSAQAVFRRAVDLSATPAPRRLLGAHVVLAVAEREQGTAARALRHLRIDREALAAAAREVLAEAGA